MSVGSSGAGGGRASGGTREPEWKPTRHSYGSSPHPYMEAVRRFSQKVYIHFEIFRLKSLVICVRSRQLIRMER